MLMTVISETVISLTNTLLEFGGAKATFALTNGKFNTKGIIYGTTTLRAHNSTITGRLTGLIGEKGAVAIFASDPGGGVPYVGGFVAAPPCTSAAGTPFRASCTDNVAEQTIFVNGCDDDSITVGCDQSITGVAGGTTINECIANPYNFECGGRDGRVC